MKVLTDDCGNVVGVTVDSINRVWVSAAGEPRAVNVISNRIEELDGGLQTK